MTNKKTKIDEREQTLARLGIQGRSVESYEAFRDQFYNPSSVLYPSCAEDASPAGAFNNVIFVDLDQSCIDNLRKLGLNAICKNIRDYKPKETHDLLLLINPALGDNNGWATQHLTKGGYIITNDYHNTEEWLYQRPKEFNLLGTIDSYRDGSKPRVNLDTQGLLTPVKSLDELKSIDPARYNTLQKMSKYMLSINEVKPTGNPEEDYRNFCKCTGNSVRLPFQRTGNLYLFRKQ